jgi:hypothetical protein
MSYLDKCTKGEKMRSTLRTLKWIGFNSIIALSIIIGFHYENEGFKNMAIFIAWFCFIVSFVCITDGFIKHLSGEKRPIYAALDTYIDLVFVAAFIYFGCVITAIAYLIHTIFISYAKHMAWGEK